MAAALPVELVFFFALLGSLFSFVVTPVDLISPVCMPAVLMPVLVDGLFTLVFAIPFFVFVFSVVCAPARPAKAIISTAARKYFFIFLLFDELKTTPKYDA